ncbi:MAG: hypothetical protein KF878_23910 [Planctomycetes bacterium]|nr:hypothetical protein [Planctomycetota bacterium]
MGAADDRTRRPLSVVGLLVGVVVDLGGTFLVSLGVALLTAVVLGSPEDVQRALTSTSMLVSGVLLGLTCTLLGGYACAAVAGHRHVDHGLVLGVLEVAIVLVLVAGLPDAAPSPAWSTLIPIALTVPASCAGAWLRGRRAAAPASWDAHLIPISLATLVATSVGSLVVPPPAPSAPPAAPAAPAPPVRSVPRPAAAQQPSLAPPARELEARTLPPPVVDQAVVATPPAATPDDAPLRLEGAADPTYREAPPADGPRIGGSAPAPSWRLAHELAPDLTGGGRLHLVGDQRRVAVATESRLYVLDASRSEPLQFHTGDSNVCLALSGNRLLVGGRLAVRVVDLDRGELLQERVRLGAETLRVCALEPRRAYVDAWGVTSVLDVGRLRVVAASPQEVPIRRRDFDADGRGRLVYLFDRDGIIVQDPARGFAPVCTRRESLGAVRVDPAGRFLFSAQGVRRAGSLERVDAPGGDLLGALSDGSLLVQAAGVLERRDPLTARRLGEPLAEPSENVRFGPALLAGTDRLVRVRDGRPPKLEVLDVPLDEPAAVTTDVLRLEALPPPATAGSEWTYAPRVSEPADAALDVTGPDGLTWDGTTARWRPTADDVGARLVTISAHVAGDRSHEVQEPVVVGLRRLSLDLPHGVTKLEASLAPSGRVVAWCTSRDFGTLDPVSGVVRALGLIRCTGFAEVGDSFWVASGGALVELSSPDLLPLAEVHLTGAAPRLVAALRDGRVGWADAPGPARVRLGRFRPGANTCEVIEGAWSGELRQLTWWDADRVFIGAAVRRWGIDGLTAIDGYTGPVEGVLPDGTVITTRRLFGVDGSLVREHSSVIGASHDGTHYATLERQQDRTHRAAVRSLRSGEVLTSVALPAGLQGLFLASRASAFVGYTIEAKALTPEARHTCTFIMIPYALPGPR